MPADYVKIYLWLLERSKLDVKIGLTITELAMNANVGIQTICEALPWLEEEKMLRVEKKTKHHLLYLDSYWTGNESKPIPFTYEPSDDTRRAKAEEALRNLQRERQQEKGGERSGVTNFLKGEEQQVVGEIERDLGRSLTHGESYYLGKTFATFGPQRVKDVWRRQAATAREPVRALYAILWKGARGKPAKEKETRDQGVKYPKITFNE